MTKTSQFFTVRSEKGQYLGTYSALSAERAIQRLKDEQAALCSTFKKSHRIPRLENLTATVEGSNSDKK